MAKPLKQGISHLFTITRINGSTKSRDRSVFLSRDLLQLDAAENSNRHQYHDECPARELDLRRDVARFRYRKINPSFVGAAGTMIVEPSSASISITQVLPASVPPPRSNFIEISFSSGAAARVMIPIGKLPMMTVAVITAARILFMSDTLSTLKYQQLNRLSS